MRTLNENGEQTSSLEVMKSRVIRYFTDLYNILIRASLVPNLSIPYSDCISIEMAVWLCCYLTLEEVKGVLFEMP